MNAKQRRVARRADERDETVEDVLMRPHVLAALAELDAERVAHPDRPLRDWREELEEMTIASDPPAP